MFALWITLSVGLSILLWNTSNFIGNKCFLSDVIKNKIMKFCVKIHMTNKYLYSPLSIRMLDCSSNFIFIGFAVYECWHHWFLPYIVILYKNVLTLSLHEYWLGVLNVDRSSCSMHRKFWKGEGWWLLLARLSIIS